MDLFRRIFFAAVLAGAVAGLAFALVQQWRVVPLILQAETYEAEHAHDAAGPHTHEDGATHSHQGAADPWTPADGWERASYTILATTLAGVGFALVISAISVLTGMEITLANGALWGLGGFLAFNLAPAFGLPPELPGMAAADLGLRQVWWWATALLTGGALIGMARFRSPAAIAIGIALILLPHLVGAPAAPQEHSEVPAHLATAFAATALTASMVYWLVAGSLIGWFNEKFGAAS